MYFLLLRVFEQLALALKNRVALKFFTEFKYFLSFRIFEQLALALKNRVALKFFTVFKYFVSFRIFEQVALALKTEFSLKIFKPGEAATAPDPRLCPRQLRHYPQSKSAAPPSHGFKQS